MSRPDVLVDIGVNLAHRSFAQDLPQVIARARDAGVLHQVVTGTSLEQSRRAVELAGRYPKMLTATVGVHPHAARTLTADTLSRLRVVVEAHAESVVAIGECGLDYYRELSSRKQQREAFQAQLSLAVDMRLPVFLHERHAHADFLPILSEFRPDLVGAVVHCFTGSRAELDAYLELGCHIGLTGWLCDPRRGGDVLALAKHLPRDRLMLETDAPFLLPRGIQTGPGRRNEPAFLPAVLAAAAEAGGQSCAALARQTTDNAVGFFGLRLEQPSTGESATCAEAL